MSTKPTKIIGYVCHFGGDEFFLRGESPTPPEEAHTLSVVSFAEHQVEVARLSAEYEKLEAALLQWQVRAKTAEAERDAAVADAQRLRQALRRLVDTDEWLDAAPDEQVEAEGNARLDADIVAARAALAATVETQA